MLEKRQVLEEFVASYVEVSVGCVGDHSRKWRGATDPEVGV